MRAALEAILFVAESPIPEGELAEVLECPIADVKAVLIDWADDLQSSDRGITLRQAAGGWRLYTKPETHGYLERFSATARASQSSGGPQHHRAQLLPDPIPRATQSVRRSPCACTTARHAFRGG